MNKVFLMIGMVALMGCEYDNRVVVDYEVGTPYAVVDSYDAGKLALSFDDGSVEMWHDAINIFDMYDAKVSFFISRYHKFNDEQKLLLKDIQSRGHEIGFHGVNHINAVKYIEINGASSYVDNEIVTGVKNMEDDGFVINSFAFPYSSTNAEVNGYLEPYFNNIRSGTRVLSESITNGEDQLSLAFGVDNIDNDGFQLVMDAMDLAHNNNDYILFYAHKISLHDSCGDQTHCIDRVMLIKILDYAQSIGMRFSKHKDI